MWGNYKGISCNSVSERLPLGGGTCRRGSATASEGTQLVGCNITIRHHRKGIALFWPSRRSTPGLKICFM
jgi:hypothetical protein